MSETETIDPRYRGLDTWSDLQILDALYTGQARAISAVRPALPAIAAAAGAIAGRIEPKGRLIYAGAGSSGRQAALDGMELGSTFGWPVERLAFVLAEGVVLDPAVRMSDEDDAPLARAAVNNLELGTSDCMIAIAASGTTPFTLAAAETARAAGALVIGMANNAGCAAPATRRSADPAPDRRRDHLRVDAHERRNGAEGSARSSLYLAHDAPRPRA